MSLDSDDMIARVRAALLPVRIADREDEVKREGQRLASVLMPLVLRDGEWRVILTKRPETMPSHPGQISFPGGKREIGETAIETALRETEEEVGLKSDTINIIGRLKSFNAVSYYRITPFVGIVDSGADIIPDAREVEDVFETPLAFLMDAANHIPRDVTIDEIPHRLYDMPWHEPGGPRRDIWGMTAMIMYRLFERGFEG